MASNSNPSSSRSLELPSGGYDDDRDSKKKTSFSLESFMDMEKTRMYLMAR